MPKTSMSMRPGAADVAATLGNYIRQARIERQWTIAEFGARIGVSSPTVRAMETGSGAVSIGNYLNAADMLRIPLFSSTAEERRRVRNASDAMVALMPKRAPSPRRDDEDELLDF